MSDYQNHEKFLLFYVVEVFQNALNNPPNNLKVHDYRQVKKKLY